jgi:hypothetical protein
MSNCNSVQRGHYFDQGQRRSKMGPETSGVMTDSQHRSPGPSGDFGQGVVA